MKHSIKGGAASLLEKSRSYTRGQNFTSDGRGNLKKAQQEQKQPSRNPEDEDIAAYLSQLSKKTSGKKKNVDDISSGLSDLSLSDEVKTSNTMKFMKKSSSSSTALFGSSQRAQSIQPSVRKESGTISGKKTKSFTSSALQRASKLSAKITSRHMNLDSDDSSEDRSDKYHQELDFTCDSPSPPVSEPKPDKFRFLKKPPSKAQEPVQDKESKQANPPDYDSDELYAPNNARDTRMNSTVPLTSTPATKTQRKSNTSSRNVYSKIMAELDTDEESIDYLLGDTNLSPSLIKEVEHSDRISDQVSDNDVSAQKISDNGYLEGDMDVVSADESIVESIGEDIGLTLDGLQTIDDLLPPSAIHSPVSSSHHDIPSHHTDTESIRSRSPSPVEDSVASNHDDASYRSRTADNSYSSVASYSSASFLSETKSHSFHSRSSHSYSRSSSRSTSTRSKKSDSSVRTITSARSDSYSHDFDTLSNTEDKTTSDDKTLTDDETISSDFSSASTMRSHSKRIRPISGQDVGVQTSGSLHSINHHWLNDYNFQTPSYFNLLSANNKDTVSHHVDPSVLQTLSTFDSTSLLLHTNLLAQVRQTQLAITNTMRQHQAFLDSLQEDYSYTTLENTKSYIKKQKKRRRKVKRKTSFDGEETLT
ncbi:uncharacterized protein LOC121424473 isoform X2 [Lytechinus variegatus]|uniref:uncharacterized protein LOC121424473 isoform X2 n=1 Tax=Lytechinus variegatus TaxID=7654 RepID=UPI001BB0EEFD|nr:uncharacterized protein LOC121424473 isoform X2 [Lytechinus variegatus]